VTIGRQPAPRLEPLSTSVPSEGRGCGPPNHKVWLVTKQPLRFGPIRTKRKTATAYPHRRRRCGRQDQQRARRPRPPAPDDPERRAGLGIDAVLWLRERDVALFGGDCVELLPGREAALPLPLHQLGIGAMGLTLLDWPHLDRVHAMCNQLQRHDFLLTVAPPPIIGGPAHRSIPSPPFNPPPRDWAYVSERCSPTCSAPHDAHDLGEPSMLRTSAPHLRRHRSPHRRRPARHVDAGAAATRPRRDHRTARWRSRDPGSQHCEAPHPDRPAARSSYDLDGDPVAGAHRPLPAATLKATRCPWPPTRDRRNTPPYPVGCQNSAMAPDHRLQAAASYSLRSPPRIGRRRIRP